METKKPTTTKKTNSTAKKTTTTAKKTTSASKSSTTKKVAAKKPATTKKTTTVNKPTTKKPTTTVNKTTTKKPTTTAKPVTKKPAIKSSDSVTVDEVIEALTKSNAEPKVETKPSVEPIIEREIDASPEDFGFKKPVEKKVKVKRKIKIRPVVKLIFLILIVAAILLCAKKIFCKKDSYKDKATYSTSFFIRDNKGKYALFNEKGKKLSDFIYDSTYSFINDVALVYNEKEGYALINNKGKDIISYGKYNYISAYAGLYKVRSDKGYKLLDSEGKTLIDAESIDVSSYGDDYPFSIVTANKEVKVISYDGSTITTFKYDKDAKSPTVNHINEYSTVFYNGKNVVFNSKTKKVINESKTSVHYCINNVGKEGKILTLNSCALWYETLSEKKQAVIVKGKLIDLSKKCDDISLYEDVLTCSTSNGEYFVKVSGKKATLGSKINSRSAFIDDENYVTRNEKNYKLDFYKNGKKVKTIDASLSSTGKMLNDVYVLYVDNGYEFYNKEGKKVIKQNFKYASAFDQNGLARVSDDGSTYYLINEKGKKVSDKYGSISAYVNYYLVTNKNGLKGIINKKGKEILSTKYTSIVLKTIRDTYYAVATDKDGKYFLYNLDKDKLIKESKDSITLSEHYIKVSGKKVAYYTFKDKLIYEEK